MSTLADLKEAQRKRFHELGAMRDAIVAVSAPLRAKLDGNTDTMTGAQERALRAQILAAEAGLYDIDVERGNIARLLRDPDGKSRLGSA